MVNAMVEFQAAGGEIVVATAAATAHCTLQCDHRPLNYGAPRKRWSPGNSVPAVRRITSANNLDFHPLAPLDARTGRQAMYGINPIVLIVQ